MIKLIQEAFVVRILITELDHYMKYATIRDWIIEERDNNKMLIDATYVTHKMESHYSIIFFASDLESYEVAQANLAQMFLSLDIGSYKIKYNKKFLKDIGVEEVPEYA